MQFEASFMKSDATSYFMDLILKLSSYEEWNILLL